MNGAAGSRLATATVILVAAVFAAAEKTLGQSEPADEIVIHYQEGSISLPPPRREGNVYVIAVPRSLAPVPEKLVAPFVNEIEGENEVWRFEVKDNTAVTVSQMGAGIIRLRIAERGSTRTVTQSEPPLPRAPAPLNHSATAPDSSVAERPLRPSAAPSAPLNVDANGSARTAAAVVAKPDIATVESKTLPMSGPLNVDANGSALTVAAVGADPDIATVKSQTLPLANLDLAVPQSPAFAILGITPDNIINPSSPRELAFSLLNGVGPNGAFQSGIAIDTAPYLLLAGRNKTLVEYQDDYLVRFFSRIQFSFATAKGAQDTDPSLKLALGLHFTFFDLGDPRLDREYIDKLSAAFDELGFINPMDPNAAATARSNWLATVEKIRKEAKARNWNRSSWSFGLAPSWIDETGDSGNYQWNGGAAWTSLAYGFDTEPFLNTGLDKTSQLILHLRYRNHEQIPDPVLAGSFYTEDSALAALRLRIGSPEFNVSLDGAYVREWNSGTHNGSSYRLAFIVERKMAANLWLRLSYGKEFDTPDGKDSSLFLGSFHLGAGEEASQAAAK